MLTLQIGLENETCSKLSDFGFSVIVTDAIVCEEEVLLSEDYYKPRLIIANLTQAPWVISATRTLRKKGIRVPVLGIYSGESDGSIDQHAWWCDLHDELLRGGITSVLRGPVPDALVVSAAQVLRRLVSDASCTAQRTYIVHNQALEYDDESHCLKVNGSRVHLTHQESRFFSELLESMGKPLTKDGLLNALCFDRPDADRPELKLIDVLACKVRRKLREANPALEALIETVWGKGYVIQRLVPSEEADIVRPDFGRKVA